MALRVKSRLVIISNTTSWMTMPNSENGWLPTTTGCDSTGTPMTLPLLRFWRGESKHADQLQTHLESKIHPLSVLMFTPTLVHCGEKALTSTTRNSSPKPVHGWMTFPSRKCCIAIPNGFKQHGFNERDSTLPHLLFRS